MSSGEMNANISADTGVSASTQKLPIMPSSDIQDLICIGFGPASIAIGVALTDAQLLSPNVTFLERQPKFSWHSGMQLPGAKMQISFLKDMATPRNPHSHFTFINYLFAKGRLNNFINLSTFLPSRAEYEDYLRWVARYFEHRGVVRYGQEVVAVEPQKSSSGKVSHFNVTSRHVATGEVTTRSSKRVVVAVGGKARLPPQFPENHPQIVHSSQYSSRVHRTLPDSQRPYHIAVVGNGQSGAEIFNDLPSRFPNAKVTMIIKGAHLRPSDDSPFVNEVFDPDRVDGTFAQDPEVRAQAITLDKATNYGVVRLELLEHLYDTLYSQKVKNPDPSSWCLNIIPKRQVVSTATVDDKLLLKMKWVEGGNVVNGDDSELAVDAVFVATGYLRNAHEDILKQTRDLLPEAQREGTKFTVSRDYKVLYDESKIEEGAGVWLQGCNEKTHGLSDSLLSILAVRGGELVESMFGKELASSGVERVRAMI
ncbi:hypothetical protein BP5796_06147 [Coleophoma crateriformis]|uniref:L-ornithine N(5)-monooxygenase [NAD(P)H] n=1 Tax=Coleophoma crateriformis TaxID=565419 RepID=A0A3D8RWA5_9HELO|nr:hypothetical protein BP5796_06147 [Coleophoma crateriformis]